MACITRTVIHRTYTYQPFDLNVRNISFQAAKGAVQKTKVAVSYTKRKLYTR